MFNNNQMIIVTITLSLIGNVYLAPAEHITSDVLCDSNAMANSPHGQPQPHDTLPYVVTASSENYSNGNSIQVTVAGIGNATFKSYLVRAIDVDTNNGIGTWKTESGESGLKPVPGCNAVFKYPFKVVNIEVITWIPPVNSSGKVKFVATIVESIAAYWIDINSVVKHN